MITSEQRALRRNFIGSSDASAVLGLNPWRSAADVWLSKTGQVDDAAGNGATDAGTRLESVVLDWAEEQLSAALLRDRMVVHPNGLLAANCDGIQPCVHVGPLPPPFTEPFIVEAKTTGIVGPADESYGEVTEGERVELPDHVIIQTHHQMICAGVDFRVAWVPVLIGRVGFRMYRVDRSDDLAAVIETRCSEFVEKYVRTGTRPDDFKPSLEVLKRIRREPNKVVPVADELVDAVVAARAAKKRAGEDAEAAEAALLAAMGTAEGATYSRGTASYLESKRRGYTVEACTFRSLRIKAEKGVPA